MKRQRNGRNLERFVRRNLEHLERACWLAAAWHWDAHRNCDTGMAAACLRDSKRFLKMEKALKRYRANSPIGATGGVERGVDRG